MFSYTIYNEANTEKFAVAMHAIEDFLSVKREKLLEDVDGSLYARYNFHGKKIELRSDYDVDAVYCDAEIDLSELFGDPI